MAGSKNNAKSGKIPRVGSMRHLVCQGGIGVATV